MTEVLESSVAVDTSILEQYLSNHFDPHNLCVIVHTNIKKVCVHVIGRRHVTDTSLFSQHAP